MTPNRASSLILPVESQVRELDAKLFLSCVAAERGFRVVIGSRAYVHHAMASLPRGVYLAKSMRRMSDRMFDIIPKLGHAIVAWDEEGLVRFPDPFYYQRRLSAKAMRQVDALFAWGPDDARAFRAFDGYPGCPIHLTGNPRIDLMRPELRGFFDAEVAAIRARFGSFVLVNTNFSGLNHFHENLSELKATIAPGSGVEPTPFMVGRALFRNSILSHFQQLIPALSRLLPDHKVVVRPHPSEGHGLWRNLAKGLRNVEVVNEGNVTAWLLACKALVHNGCTTGVEAAVLGTPAVAFQPVIDDVYDMQFPNSVSHHAYDLKDVEKTLRSIVDGTVGARDEPEVRAILSRHLAALDGKLAADRMVDVLIESGYGENRPDRASRARELEARLHLFGRTWVKRFNRHRPGHRNNMVFHRHRFPGVGIGDLEAKVERFAAQTGRFRDVQVGRLSEHIFTLSS